MTQFEASKQADVLVIDDEDDIREVLELSFLRMGLTCDTAASLAEAHQRLENGRYRMCLADMRLTDGDGLDLVTYIQNHIPDLPIAVMTAYGSIETAIRALKNGAFDFVTKPVDMRMLRELINHALRLEAVQVKQEKEPGSRKLIGRSPPMQYLRDQIDKLARSQAPVFIQGESGTGKEVVARLIHTMGPRSDAPFVPVNCGAFTPELMESEFFGYKKGSFTGAVADKEGLFKVADGGTLFLDEVADLPLPMQVKLLRAIQERAIRPVGGREEEKVDVRILSASHRDLAAMVAEGKFRQDLFFRINVITLNIPPLRERAEDIEDLANMILERLAQRDHNALHLLSDTALQALRQYSFPGNVRELENILERACALAEGDVLQAQDFHLMASAAFSVAPSQSTVMPQYPPAEVRYGGRYEDTTGDQEKILKVLEDTRWNRSEAARRLGMTLRQLRYRLRKWGLE